MKRILASALFIGLLGVASPAQASCGDFGGLAQLINIVAGVGAAGAGGLAGSGVMYAFSGPRDYAYGSSAGISVGIGGAAALILITADFATECGIVNSAPGLLLTPAISFSTAVITSIVLLAIAPNKDPPVAVGFVPREGGGQLTLALKF